MKKELKIGMFMAIAAIILAAFIFIVGDISVIFRKEGYPLYASFDTAAGLEKKAVVRMAGVKIGYVKDIRLEKIRAKVLMSLNPGVEVPRDSKATMAALGLLGEKYIEILPGEEKDFCLPGSVIEGIPPVSFDQLGSVLLSIGNEVKEMGKALRDVLGEEELKTNLKETIQNLSSFTGDLKEFFGESKGNLNQSLEKSSKAIQKFDQRVEEISQNLDELISVLRETVEENREHVKINLEHIKELITKTEESLRLLNESLEKINKGEGTLGKLIREPELYERAEEAVRDLERVIHPVSNIRASVGLRTEYYGESDFLKNYLSFSLWPTKEEFLLAQIIHDPWLDKFTYSAQGGVRWGTFSPRAGIMESKFGLGIDYFVFHDRLKFSIESFDFNRRPRPRFKLWTRYAASKYLYLLLGIDDFTLASRREFFFGLGLELK
ncbi:MAG: MCE family protein [Candidatus Aminicenantes bacterium]|nr:MAG: MCE family protein [Candidatus Aminicenantes bacterium]